MEAELAALATSGATTLVGLMASDTWAQAKTRLAALIGRGGTGEPAVIEGELEESRDELTAARDNRDQDLAHDVEATLRLRLRRLLQSDPALADELRELLDDLTAEPGVRTRVSVHNEIRDATVNNHVIQVGYVSGGITKGRGTPL